MSIKADLTQVEWELILKHRENQKELTAYNRALHDAARELYSVAAQCCGGSGQGGDEYKRSAAIVERLTKVSWP